MNTPLNSPATDLRFSRVLSSNRVWLAAGRRASIAGESFRILGYIPETCLGQQAHWRRRTSEARDAAEQEMLKARRRSSSRPSRPPSSRSRPTSKPAAEGLQPNLRKLREDWASGEIDLTRVGKALRQSLADMQARQRHRDLAEQIGRTVRLSDYPDTFPARRRPRRLIAVLGPTNSGKTHDAFERLATAASGIYLGPLRLLALEAFTRLNDEFGVSASLITGEERRIVEGSRVTASTIEMLDPTREIDVAVIDEIQMLSDPDRGWAWTQAVVGANAREVWLLGALSAEPAIQALAARLGLPLEVRHKTRKHPSSSATPSPTTPPARCARPGAATPSSCSPGVTRSTCATTCWPSASRWPASTAPCRPRCASARPAASPGGDADILVATDAIGMGLNLPIQRVVFTAVHKYDGVKRAELTPSLLQQIGGRAGRFGHQDEEGVVAGLTPAEHGIVTALMKAPQPALAPAGFQITAGSAYLEQIADMSGDRRLEALLSLFLLHADCGDGFFTPFVPEEQLARAAQLDRMKRLTLQQKHTFSMAPMASQNETIDGVWRDWAYTANQGKPIQLNFLPASARKAS
jgi:ATP-dependent RNA helicase SUPV3L1/SUV3